MAPTRHNFSRKAATNKFGENKASANGSSSDQYEDTEWEVVEVVGKRYENNGKIFYQLKWKDWEGEPTWEPEENCTCSRLIKEFESRIVERLKRESSSIPLTPGGVRVKSTPRRGRRV